MRLLEESRDSNPTPDSKFVDMATIRRRVAMIKSGWSNETAKARAAEGERRRQDLEDLLLSCLCDETDSEEAYDLSESGFSLVG